MGVRMNNQKQSVEKICFMLITQTTLLPRFIWLFFHDKPLVDYLPLMRDLATLPMMRPENMFTARLTAPPWIPEGSPPLPFQL
eukprot:scaffold255982_cov22-Prasinocladus_malaysianus.AAC.1